MRAIFLQTSSERGNWELVHILGPRFIRNKFIDLFCICHQSGFPEIESKGSRIEEVALREVADTVEFSQEVACLKCVDRRRGPPPRVSISSVIVSLIGMDGNEERPQQTERARIRAGSHDYVMAILTAF